MYSSTVQNCYTEGKIYAKDAFSLAGGVVASSGAYDNLITGCLANVSIQITTDESEYTITPGIGSKHTFVGAIVGSGGGTLSNSIYITDTFTGNIEDDNYTVTNSHGFALSEMTDGAAAHILGAAWGQNIDNGQTTQALPVLGGAVVYYGYTDCTTDDLHYSNTKLNPTKGHAEGIFAQGHELISACSYCGANEQGRLTLVAPADLIFEEGVAKTATYTCTLPDCTATHAIEYCCPGGCMTPGTHTASVTVGDATATLAFEITSNLTFPSDVTVEITTEQQYLVYRGASGVKPAVSVKKGGVELTKDTDYSVYYSNNINVTDAAQVTVVLHITGYEGASKTLNFSIVPFNMSLVTDPASFEVEYGAPMWDAFPVTLSPVTSDGSMFSFDYEYFLIEGVDFIVHMTEEEYEAQDAGTVSLSIEGIGNFTGVKQARFEITQADLATEGRFEITVENDLLVYNGEPLDPTVTVYDTLRGEYLTFGYNGDFYFPRHEYYPGTHSISLMGTGNYTGSLDDVGTFEILKADAKPQLATNTVTMDYDPELDIEATIKNALSPTLTLAGYGVYHGTLQYEYRAVGDTDFISGLPVYAGAYEIRVVIGESNAPDSGAYNLLTSEIATVTVNKLKVTVTVLDQYLEDGQSPNTYPSPGTTYTIEFANFADQILTEITLAVGTDGHDVEVSSLNLLLDDGMWTNINANCDITINTGKAHRVSSTWTVGLDTHTRTCSVEGCGYVQEEAHHSHVLTQDDTALTVSGVCGICSADCGTITLVLPQNAVYNGKPHLATLTGEIRGIDLNDTAYVEINQSNDPINRGNNVDAALYVYSYGTDGYMCDSAMLIGRYSIAQAEVTVEIEDVEIEQYSALPTEFTYTVIGLADGHTAVAEWLLRTDHSNTVGTFSIALNGVSFYDADGNEVSDNYDYDVYTEGTLTVTAHTVHKEFDADGICGVCHAGYEMPETDEDGTYLLSKLGHLYWLAEAADGNVLLNAKMVADIDLNKGYTFSLDADGNLVVTQGESTVTDLSVLRTWTPIRGYRGTFDGNGFTVSGLYFNSSYANEVGLFGSLGENATVRNVKLVNSYILAQQMVGGIVGNNPYVGEIKNCYNAAIIVSNNQYVGGIVGYNEGVVSGCENVGRISGDFYVGGIAGYNGCDVLDSINRADISATADLGGVAGSNGSSSDQDARIEGCTNLGDLTATGTYYYAGGIAGKNHGMIRNCLNAGDLQANGLNAAGGITGTLEENGIVSSCLNLGHVSCERMVGGIVGQDFGTVDSPSIVEFGFYLDGTATGGIGGEDEANRAEAVTAEQLASGEISYRLNSAQSTDPVWGQTLGTDTQPALGGAPVYLYYTCDYKEQYTNTANTPDQEHEDTDDDHLCDACEAVLTACGDSDNDHLCDICGEVRTACHDSDNDHKCDLCGETVSECKNDSRDHACDVCGEILSSCEDLDRDHVCDTCGTILGECLDVEGKDHLCDICGGRVSYCSDDDKDHDCDHCGEILTACEDLNNDHYCDTLGERLSDCTDEDNNHYCDLCYVELGVCEDYNGDHQCDTCGELISECTDDNLDHHCDICSEQMTACEDLNSDHKCDVCDEVLSECEDENSDHLCDACGEKLSEHVPVNGGEWITNGEKHGKRCEICAAIIEEEPHEDHDNDHLCDVCEYTVTYCDDTDHDHNCDLCGEAVSNCIDWDNDHMCDDCGVQVNECYDTDDHNCDICGEKYSDCEDLSHDHKCDVCGEVLSECVAANGGDWIATETHHWKQCELCFALLEAEEAHYDNDSDHMCDVCQMTVSDCADTNNDHLCDICDREMSTCIDADSDHDCDICGTELSRHEVAEGEHTCTWCGATVTDCEDTSNDHICDVCGEAVSECVDTDPADHLCDVCDKDLGECADENDDHKCDVCGEVLSECVAANDGNWIVSDELHWKQCEICSAIMEEQEAHDDDNNDHLCDVCQYPTSSCTDSDHDHKCDVCGATLSACTDVDPRNHACDICGNPVGEHKRGEDGTCDHCGEPVTCDCVDEDKNHACDVCNTPMGTHAAAEGKHTCDWCGATMSSCDDANSDHVCDVCGAKMGTHEAAEGKHTCDWCGATVTACNDADTDHDCDVCGAQMGTHAAADGKHTCNYCGETVTACDDANSDHVCDVCGEKTGVHEAAEGTHICNYCGEIATDCTDENRDHLCDVCGEAVSEHSWANATCISPKTCTVCGATEGEPSGHTPGDWVVDPAPAPGVAGQRHQACTVCGETVSVEAIDALPVDTGNAPAQTTPNEGSASDVAPEEKSGCGATVKGGSAIVLITLLGIGLVLLRKKRNTQDRPEKGK